METMKMLNKNNVRCLVLAFAAGVAAAPTLVLAQESKPAAPAAGGDAIVLKPHFVKDAVHKFAYHIERTDTNTITGPQAANSPTSTVAVDADMTVTVKDVTDKGATLDLTVVAIKATSKTPLGETKFDSGKPEDDKDRENPTYLAFKPLVGMTISLATDGFGMITNVSGDPATPQGSLAPVANQFFTNADYLKFRWNNALIAKRDGAAVKVGESWSQADVFLAPQVGRFEQTLKHTLKGVKDGAATIDTTGEMKISAAKEGAALAFELKDTNILATSTWDVADGLSRSFDMQRAFTLDGSAQGLPVKRQSQEKLSITRAK
jgi:hypothetical protein